MMILPMNTRTRGYLMPVKYTTGGPEVLPELVAPRAFSLYLVAMLESKADHYQAVADLEWKCYRLLIAEASRVLNSVGRVPAKRFAHRAYVSWNACYTYTEKAKNLNNLAALKRVQLWAH